MFNLPQEDGTVYISEVAITATYELVTLLQYLRLLLALRADVDALRIERE